MREVRIYQSGTYNLGDEVALSPEASLHVGVVLRMRPQDKLTLFCGDNREFSARIEVVKKKQVIVRITNAIDVNRESPITICLAQALSKGDKMEWVMQKAVELGVAQITPVITERCAVKLDAERLQKKWHQWQSIAVAACEQSGRNTVPVVHQPISFERYINQVDSDLKLVLYPLAAKSWRELVLNQSTISLLIGPEGGLSDAEILQAKTHGFQSLSLGPRVLRTETAAITALSVLQAVAGDL